MGGDPVLQVSVTVGGELYEANLEEELAVTRQSLDDECIKQAGKFSWWAVLAENAKVERDCAKERMSLVSAELDAEIRDEWAESGEKITDKKVAAAVERHGRYQETVEAYHEACRVYGVLDVARQAFAQRKDMLVTLAANARQEQEAEVSIKKREPEAAADKVSWIKKRIKDLAEKED